MTITPIRKLVVKEKAHHPSVLNRPLEDVLSGSGYNTDGSDFAGFAKKDDQSATAGGLATEIAARIAGDAGNATAISGEATARVSGDAAARAYSDMMLAQVRDLDGMAVAADAEVISSTLTRIFVSGVSRSLRFDRLAGFVARFFGVHVITDPKYGAVGNGVHDDTSAFQNAADAVASAGGGNVYVPTPPVAWLVTQTVQLSSTNVRFQGSSMHATVINFTGSGALFQVGTDNGLAWDGSNYDGPSNHAWSDLMLVYTGTTTPLNNSTGLGYGAGTYAIRDWRSGSCRINRVRFKSWDYWFWGVQSDLNFIQDILPSFCHSGCYLGPRSDQATVDHVWSFLNDVVFQFEGSQNAVVRRWISDGDGSATDCPVVIRASAAGIGANGSHFASTRRISSLVFDTPWIEASTSGALLDVPAVFDVCNGDTVQSGAVVIRDPHVTVNRYNTGGLRHVFYLVRAGNLTSVHVERLAGATISTPWSNMKGVFNVLASSPTPPKLFLTDVDFVGGGVVDNFHASATTLYMPRWELANYFNNTLGGTGGVTVDCGAGYKSRFSGTKAYDAPSIANGAQSPPTTVTVTGAALGDIAQASLNIDQQGLLLHAYVSAANTVTVILKNDTGAAVDLPNATVLRADVVRH